MALMGWQGGGLGKEGEGRVEPVPATLYPQGKSLDWCMERRYVLSCSSHSHLLNPYPPHSTSSKILYVYQKVNKHFD
jgi:hypothetical protein